MFNDSRKGTPLDRDIYNYPPTTTVLICVQNLLDCISRRHRLPTPNSIIPYPSSGGYRIRIRISSIRIDRCSPIFLSSIFFQRRRLKKEISFLFRRIRIIKKFQVDSIKSLHDDFRSFSFSINYIQSTTLEADIALEFESLFVNFLFLHVFPEAEIKKGNFFSVQKNNLRKF